MSTMVKRGILIGLLLLIVSGITIYFTIDLDSLATLGTFNLTSLLLAIVALALGMYFDGLRLQRLVRMFILNCYSTSYFWQLFYGHAHTWC